MNELLRYLPQLLCVVVFVCGMSCAILGYCCVIVGARADEEWDRARLIAILRARELRRLHQYCEVPPMVDADG
jgi:hypothetical protein